MKHERRKHIAGRAPANRYYLEVDGGAADDMPRTRGRRAMRHAGRGFKWVVFAALPFVVMIGLAAALGYVRLRHGPISLAFLAGPIERSINAELQGYRVRIGDAIVRLTDSGRLEFRLAKVSFVEADGDTVVSAPLAAVELAHRSLLQGMLVPSRVELIEPRLFLAYSPRTGLSLSFTAPANVPAPRPAHRPDAASSEPQPAPVEQADAGSAKTDANPLSAAARETPLKRLDVGALLKRLTAETRTRAAASQLRELGFRDASVIIDNDGAESLWRVPELSLDLDHRGQGSVISGSARVASDAGGWRVVFHTEETAGNLALHASVRDFVPSKFATADGALPLLSRLDMPIGADVSLTFAKDGRIAGGDLAVELGRGRIALSTRDHQRHPIELEAALLRASYDASAGTIDIMPSTVRWGASSVTLAGKALRRESNGNGTWAFDVAATEGTLSSADIGAAPVPLDSWTINGTWSPTDDLVRLDKFAVRAGGADLALTGAFRTTSNRPGVHVETALGPAELGVVKSVWPAFIAPLTRQWVARNVESGSLRSLTWKFVSDMDRDATRDGAAANANVDSLVIETGPAVFRVDGALPPLRAPRALVNVEKDVLELTVPEAAMVLPSGKQIAIKTIRMSSTELHRDPAPATVTFRAMADAAPALELLSTPALGLMRPLDTERLKPQGKVEAQLSMSFPLVNHLERRQITFSGNAKLSDGKAQKIFGGYDVQGATIALDITNGAVEAKGDVLVAGVTTRISWQRILEASDEQQQPPLRITATLDNADRTQLGLDVGDMLHGEVPVDVLITPGDDPKVRLRADLSSAELILDAISWTKPPGRSAFLEFDIVSAGKDRQELQGFRIAGDNIAIEGTASLGADGKLRDFNFPVFSLNLVTRLAVKGSRGGNGIWSIKADGPTFDGKDFFRALFSVGRVSEHQAEPGSTKGGLDLEASVDNVLGFSDVSLRNLKLELSRRSGKLSALEARGTLDGGAPLAARLDKDDSGKRRLRAESTDAGQAFKLTGFYPNIQKGRVRLEVNVDGAGPAEKTGTLLVESFRVLGDPVLAEVVSSIDEGRPPISGTGDTRSAKRVVRQVFEFDMMNVPFSVGHGQFVMQDAFVRGPLLGATIRGKVDYKTERMSLGGTYVPLQGLNNVFGEIPVLGQILSGPRGEGIFGITFAIQGAMASPDVIVNPLSLVAPGIFREIFQMTNPSPTVLPRKAEPPGRASAAARSSSAPPVKGTAEPVAPGTTIDGWSSSTKRN